MIGRKFVADEGSGVGSYAFRGLALHLHSATLRVLVDADMSPAGCGGTPLHGGQLGFLPSGIHQPGIHPVGPIARKSVATIGLLILSNIFMTLAWYGHLKFSEPF